MQTKYISVYKYRKDIEVDKAKGRGFPSLRGTWLPSIDKQALPVGIAINWFGVRIRVSLLERTTMRLCNKQQGVSENE